MPPMNRLDRLLLTVIVLECMTLVVLVYRNVLSM